jgi:hypothetical protein
VLEVQLSSDRAGDGTNDCHSMLSSMAPNSLVACRADAIGSGFKFAVRRFILNREFHLNLREARSKFPGEAGTRDPHAGSCRHARALRAGPAGGDEAQSGHRWQNNPGRIRYSGAPLRAPRQNLFFNPVCRTSQPNERW